MGLQLGFPSLKHPSHFGHPFISKLDFLEFENEYVVDFTWGLCRFLFEKTFHYDAAAKDLYSQI